jgi:hypothetical protein
MPIKDFSIFCEYPRGTHPQAENFARTQDLMQRLGKIHPLFAQISPKGKAGSWKRMESEPLLKDITLEQWLGYYKLRMHKDPSDDYDFGCTLSYWNRERSKEKCILIACQYNHNYHDRRNDTRIIGMAPELIQPDILPRIMEAFITAFDGEWGQYSCYDSDKPVRFSHYQIWIKDGLPDPVPGESTRYPEGHAPLPDNPVAWLGGRLYTWPQHDPRILMKDHG